MPLRNPFARRPASLGINIPDSSTNGAVQDSNHPGFERVDTVGSKASSALSVRSNKSQDTGEYKMSVVNDSGVYLPPSPTEEKGPWSRKNLSSRASTESGAGEIEQFSISRESFDSYRRSFDITAKSPINYQSEFPARQSLDSLRFPRYPRSSLHRQFEHQPPTAEEGFEDVGLDDQKQPKKRGFFSKFADAQEKDGPSPAMSRFLMSNRKRGGSGQGSELGNMEQNKPTPFGTSSER